MTFYAAPTPTDNHALKAIASMPQVERGRVFAASCADMMGRLDGAGLNDDLNSRAIYSLLIEWVKNEHCPAHIRELVEGFILDHSVQAKRCGVIWAKNQTAN